MYGFIFDETTHLRVRMQSANTIADGRSCVLNECDHVALCGSLT